MRVFTTPVCCAAFFEAKRAPFEEKIAENDREEGVRREDEVGMESMMEVRQVQNGRSEVPDRQMPQTH